MKWNPLRLFNSVPFGIAIMVLTAVYIAAGSARPWFRELGVDEWSLLRNWFDKTDLEMFNAWPLKTLMALLVANLVVVTWRKIPLTPPRYGVWCVHAGIITLVYGTSLYYYWKVEGIVTIYRDSRDGPNTVDHFYQKDQRSLYVRAGRGEPPVEVRLPSLPRFKEYGGEFGHEGDLKSRGLVDVKAGTADLQAAMDAVTGGVRFDVVGFFPYAATDTDFNNDPGSNTTGVQASVTARGATASWWMVGDDRRFARDVSHGVEIVHQPANAEMAAGLVEAAGKLFHLGVTTQAGVVPMDVEVGKTYPVAGTGYSLQIESFIPQWQMFNSTRQVPALQMMVTSPTQKFRRMALQGVATQTDFLIDQPGAGPMGKRQPKPLDMGLVIDFTVSDPFHLLPALGVNVKHTLLTPTGTGELIDIMTGFKSVAATVSRFPDGTGDVVMEPAQAEPTTRPTTNPTTNAVVATTQAEPLEEEESPHPTMTMHLQRRDHLRGVDTLTTVPPDKRDKDQEAEGTFQVAQVKVSKGDWSQTVYVPFAEDVADAPVNADPWFGGYVQVPGRANPIQLQLGNHRVPLPARLTLKKFELIPYPGKSADDPNAMMRDFVSTVDVEDPAGGDGYVDVARMNHPIYYRNGQWLFFQASYDPRGHAWTRLGIGNRPAFGIMTAGVVMIFTGLAYAFYVKPIVIRAMKRRAIERAGGGRAAAAKIPNPKSQIPIKSQ